MIQRRTQGRDRWHPRRLNNPSLPSHEKFQSTNWAAALAASAILALAPGESRASIAYGSINNFDTVNDTGHECHGFEIELEDCHSTDITYTYDYNHYGTSKITEDNSIPGHPKTFIRWAAKRNPDGTWSAYTAVPSGPISPTDGHMFTNPSVNFGGEHFGVGYYVPVSVVRYRWLIDDGAGNLINGAVVSAAPTFAFAAAGNVALVANFAAPVTITALASNDPGGTVSGGGDFLPCTQVTLSAVVNPGFAFTGWTENGAVVATTPDYTFISNSSRTVVATFLEIPALSMTASAPGTHQLVLRWPSNAAGWTLQESADLKIWTPSTLQISTVGQENTCTILPSGPSRYFRLSHP